VTRGDVPTGPVESELITPEELRLAARNHAMPLEALRYPITPVGLHYLLVHYDIPWIDPAAWRLRVVTPAGAREWTYDELSRFDDRLRATLDCTGGFWSEQDWAGALLSRLLPDPAGAGSVRVVSHTGYDRRFPVGTLPRLLLATRLGGRPLSADHGAPARLVVPDRRGFWWVKWVGAVELDALPHWWQPPFPLQ